MKEWSGLENPQFNDPGLRGLYEQAAADTYCLAWYTFESLNWQGWTVSDETGQRGIFYHVDDFVGVSPGLNGHLVPIQGTKSMWVGCRPSGTDFYVCSWKNPPGYGNGWNQNLGTEPFAFIGAITISFHMKFDSEPGYDYTRVQYDAGGGAWQNIAEFISLGDTVGEYTVPLTLSQTKVRFHFTSDGAWSDADGLWNTDGGSQVDSIRLRDVALLDNFQDFETAAVGATSAGIWIGSMGSAYGSYGGLLKNLADKDPCGDNFTTQVVFFVGSSEISVDYPGLYNTPFCLNGVKAPCQNELFVSPLIKMTKYSTACNASQNADIPVGDVPMLGGARFMFTVYRDLPLENLVLYTWGVRQIHAGCPGQWLDRNFVYYGPDQDFIFTNNDVSDLVGGTDDLQVAIGVADMCDVWYLINGNCAAHTPSPWFDNVRVYRWKTAGPQWSYRDLDFFQDNFPREEYDLNSTANADIANDLNRNDNPIIRPGDSAVVTCTSLAGGGIGTDPAGGPAVYLHVRAIDIGPDPKRPNLFGASLAGTCDTGRVGAQAPYNFRYVSDDGAEWTIIQCADARTGAGFVDDKFMVDLNDNLFQRGYEIDYYFTAKDKNAPYVETALPGRARSGGPYFEFTILPTQVSDVLFVDDWTGRGSLKGWVEDYWTPVFLAVLTSPNNVVDRYDVNGPSSAVSNGPGSRAKNKQLTDQYYKIVWDSGDLESCTISDGTTSSDQSHDCQMLIDWMSLSTHEVGLWVCGDDVAFDLDRETSTEALSLLSTWCGVDFVATSYFDKTGGRTGGGVVNPLITGDADSGVFTPGGVPETFYLYGGCAVINQFDCLEKTTDSKYALKYPYFAGPPAVQYYAGISNIKTNSAGQTVKTMWFGFSYMYIRDDVVAPPEDRFELAKDVFAWMNNDIKPNITPAVTPKSYKLAQNFPNPFNPSTSIKFDMKAKGLVTLKVYNVAGQLVRTLVNGTKDAGSYTITWDGKNDRGGAVASGIYFYKMETKDFSQTKKMVMLR